MIKTRKFHVGAQSFKKQGFIRRKNHLFLHVSGQLCSPVLFCTPQQREPYISFSVYQDIIRTVSLLGKTITCVFRKHPYMVLFLLHYLLQNTVTDYTCSLVVDHPSSALGYIIHFSPSKLSPTDPSFLTIKSIHNCR